MTTTGKLVLGAVVLVIIIAGVVFALAHNRSATIPSETASTTDTTQTPTEPVASSTSNTSASASADTSVGVTAGVVTHKTVTVTYTDQGFSPKSVSLSIGDTVKFVNQSSHGMWVASDVHPSHTEYDGTTLSEHCASGTNTKGDFDECSPATPGNSYSFTFSKAGTFQYHNHVQASDTGTITVR